MGRSNDRDLSPNELVDLQNQLSHFIKSNAPSPINLNPDNNDPLCHEHKWNERRQLFATIKRRKRDRKLVFQIKVDICDLDDAEDVQDMIKRAFAIRERTNP